MAVMSFKSSLALLMTLSFIVTSFTFVYYTVVPKSTNLPSKPSKKENVDIILTDGTITPVNNTKSFVVSAYFDPREKQMIVVIGISYRYNTDSHYCHYYCNETLLSVKAKVIVHSDHFGFPYGTTDFQCDLPCNCTPGYVSISGTNKTQSLQELQFLKVHNLQAQHKQEPSSFEYNFTVCLPTLFGGYHKVLQFVQSVEMYRILGAQQIVVYKTNCSLEMENILGYYQKTGFAKVIPWPVSSFFNLSKGWRFSHHPGDLQYFGQIVLLNECLYRNMYNSRFVILNDIDEIIVPVKHSNWHTMIEYLAKVRPGINIFRVENHIFPLTVQDENNTFPSSIWNIIPGGKDYGPNILQHVYREPDRPNIYNPMKLFVNPRSVIRTSVHSVLQKYGKDSVIPFDLCRIYHFRGPLQGRLPKEKLIKDTLLWNYSSLLITNVNSVLSASFE
ncbi:beta-1,4-galactosyltransferase galt-1-like [Protopterus annectens]|uniref:beta-1,4-galactosyltransferase galt-1-like n=1 Tax=Protopterus annectens TaxID=7888 RepID=UPI001CFB728E|nr:beta-1,4-galactosyltransferase galt-1-like [Protopterus annectens]XP_043914697.1 beta-1,4-galactosyltransferase galt-1-like [Protopterus annectens]